MVDLLTAIQTKFETYIAHLQSIVAICCPRCQMMFCLTCGDTIHKDQSQQQAKTNPLFHCSDLQGVILGVGLYMLDQQFDQQKERKAMTKTDALNVPKKRKVSQFDDR